MYSNRLQPTLQNLLRVVRFFHPRSSCTTTHISVDVQKITLYASCMTISGERTELLDIFCRVTGFTSDFLSFIDVELIWFLHGALHLSEVYS